MRRFHCPSLVAGLVVAVLALCTWVGPASAAGPRIVARPVDVMVNRPVTLRGSGFPPDHAILLTECSRTEWIVPEDPCLSENQVTVQTNPSGGFVTSMQAGICPAVKPPLRTERTCYIGEVHPSGVDTLTLVGAARIVVSWP